MINDSGFPLFFLVIGPCGGKTTGQARLCTFFENLGWKVNELKAKRMSKALINHICRLSFVRFIAFQKRRRFCLGKRSFSF